MEKLIFTFLFCLLLGNIASARSCRTTIYAALPQSKGIVTVENICSAEEFKIRQLVRASIRDTNSNEDLSTFAERLRNKLGPKYRIRVFTVEDYVAFEAEGKQPGAPN